jgi:hypothetical protein
MGKDKSVTKIGKGTWLTREEAKADTVRGLDNQNPGHSAPSPAC